MSVSKVDSKKMEKMEKMDYKELLDDGYDLILANMKEDYLTSPQVRILLFTVNYS